MRCTVSSRQPWGWEDRHLLLREFHLPARDRALAVTVALADDAFLFSEEPDGSAPWRLDVCTNWFGRIPLTARPGTSPSLGQTLAGSPPGDLRAASPPRAAFTSSEDGRMEKELVRVEFRVPVWVHVDVANRQVVSVHVDDVSVEGPVDVSAYSGAPVDEDRRQAALASTDATWPAWTIGFEHG